MSNWTHVAGIVRLDCFRQGGNPDPDFDAWFGKEIDQPDWGECEWMDFENHPELYMPSGSEGWLQKHIWINPDKGHFAAFTVSVFGDLRDHDDPQAIVDWFKKKCEDSKRYMCFIRDAIIVADNERFGQCTWRFDPETSYLDNG